LPERQLFNFMLHGIPVLCHSAMLAQKAGAIPRLQSLRSIAHQMCIRNCANWSYVITMLGRPTSLGGHMRMSFEFKCRNKGDRMLIVQFRGMPQI
jgi:hypothetical protein